jgi:hypothetical protein
MDELEEVRALRLRLKAARSLIRDLAVATARAEEALERARTHTAQPKEAQRDREEDPERYCAVA